MIAVPIQPPIGETYYPPRFPIEPPHDYIQPSVLTTAKCSAVEFTTQRGVPDIKGYLFMGKAIDTYRARNPIEIRIFQRIYSIETLATLVGLPRLSRKKIEDCFRYRTAEMHRQYAQRTAGTAAIRLDFWSSFQFMYIKDMMMFRTLLLKTYPHLVHGIDWKFLLRQPCTDVAVVLYLWILCGWHTRQHRDEKGSTTLAVLASQLQILVPRRHYSGTIG